MFHNPTKRLHFLVDDITLLSVFLARPKSAMTVCNVSKPCVYDVCLWQRRGCVSLFTCTVAVGQTRHTLEVPNVPSSWSACWLNALRTSLSGYSVLFFFCNKPSGRAIVSLGVQPPKLPLCSGEGLRRWWQWCFKLLSWCSSY